MSWRQVAVVGAVLNMALACVSAQEKPAQRASAKVPPEIVERVRAELLDDADLQDCLQEDSEEPVQVEELLSAEALDLGGGHKALAVRGSGDCLCSASGNCDLWVFQTGAGAPQLLLRASGVQDAVAQDKVNNGYRDLLVSMRVSGPDSDVFLYQFDGKEYRLVRCERRTYTDAQGRRLKQPRVLPVTCESQGKP